MADLAVTAHQHPKVAFAARTNSGSQTEPTFAFSLEHLLQGGVMTRHPNAADLLRVEREPMDHGADEIADLPGKRLQARRQEMIDNNHDAAMPVQQAVQQERDHARPASADIDDAQYLGERGDEGEAGPPAVPAKAQAARQAADTGRPVNAVSPPPRQGTAAPVPSAPLFAPAVNPPPLASAAEPTMTAPGPGQPAASIVREADFLVSQSSSALAPTAALAAEQLQGQGHRLRAASPGPSVGAAPAVTAPNGSKGSGSEGSVRPVADAGASIETGGRPSAPQAAAGGATPAGAVDPSATTAAAGVQAAQGQNGAMAATAASSLDKSLAAPSSASASDARNPAGIAASPALGDSQMARQTSGTTGAPARADPFQQRFVGDQVSVHIKKAVQEGTDRIEIRLKPEALGRVDVRLEFGPEGRVVATVTADQRHTLELLRSDARNLERALQEAGLQTDSGSLNFNLRNGSDERPSPRDGHPATAPLSAESGADSRSGQTAPPSDFGRAAARPDGIDIHA